MGECSGLGRGCTSGQGLDTLNLRNTVKLVAANQVTACWLRQTLRCFVSIVHPAPVLVANAGGQYWWPILVASTGG